MKTDRMIQRLSLLAGGGAIVAMATLAAGCSTTKEEPTTPSNTTPSSTTTSPSASLTLSPTEKAVGPGGDSFTPTINPAPPGAVCKEIVGGVCVR